MNNRPWRPGFASLSKQFTLALAIGSLCCRIGASPAVELFRDEFNDGIPGWTGVLPALGVYIDGPMLWEFDANSKSFSEQSNLYTDSSTFSGSRIAAMLINDAICPTNFTYTARMTAGDDDAFGLIWGYKDETSFYRVYFGRQNRALAGWPFQGWGVDRMDNGQVNDVFGPDNTSFINTAGRPFNVTISVTNGLLNLTVVDDPDGSATTYNLVTDGALPSVPDNARVGMFSWGQSGGEPRAFRVQNPVLSPTPLAGDPAGTVLSNWSFLNTPREDGITNITSGSIDPIWALAIGAKGNRGALIQNSDSYYAADNVVAGTTNFVAPSAVAGDVTWSNYLVSARFNSADNDGFGLLLRYQNETNFYRIAFRNQNSASGVRRGLTVQKNVNRVFDQVYSNSIAGFIPPVNVPFEVYAAVRSNQLQIIAINNPDGTPLTSATSGGTAKPTATSSGIVDFNNSVIVPDSLATGKIGVISWAQYGDNNLPGSGSSDDGTAVDWIRVNQVDGEALIVSSPYGTPQPAVGVNDFPISQVITASVDNVVNVSTGIRQINAGWAGIGSVPASGATNQVVFTLGGLSSITWIWNLQYLLTTNSTPGGTVTSTAGPWINATSNVTVTATASAGYIFTGWSGASISASTNITFPMLYPVTLTANFEADTDGDGLPDSWEIRYFGNLNQDGSGDPDNDTFSNLAEFQRGTNPNSPELLASTDGLSSRWINPQRDPALPGEVTVVDFGAGYRGAFNNNNEFRYANDLAFIPSNNQSNFNSFQTQRMIVRSNIWNDTWGTNFSASCEFTVGDNDGVCFYFRYQNESNWYRVTFTGEDPIGAVARPQLGLSVQRRVNGLYGAINTNFVSGQLFDAYADPTDGDTGIARPANTPAGFKRFRVTVNATNQMFEIHVLGFNAYLPAPDFDPAYELIVTCTDPSLTKGRIGFGNWGEGGFGDPTVFHGIPVPDGSMADNIVVKSPADGPVVFSEDWETFPLAAEYPAGWENPWLGVANLQGSWNVNVDGSLSELSNQGNSTTGTAAVPKADADGPILLAPETMSANYFIQAGVHQFDDDGIGIVYDFTDTNNYSRIILRQELSFDGAIPPGLSVSRKSNGAWTDVVAGDPSFFFKPGRPFALELSNNNGDYTLTASDLDVPTLTGKWHWVAPASAPTNRFGITTWASSSAHFNYARGYTLPILQVAVPFKITSINLDAGALVLHISKPDGAIYNVLRSTTSVSGPYIPVASNQTGSQYSETVPSSRAFYRLELVPQ